MIKKILLIFTLLLCNFIFSQVVINELDADTPSTDTLEFLELKSTTPNFSLDGYVLVFYNGFTSGTGTLSYNSIDLDGYSTDINGIFLLGNSLLSPSPALVIPNSTIQNGPDLVALYLGNASDFPLDTPATATNVVDALAYSNSATTSPTTLMSTFGLTVCVNENQTSSAATKSIQRNNDGTYAVATPTPGANNDGTGVVLNGISIASSVTELTESESFIITFTTQNPVQNSNLILNYTLSNGNFGVNDFTGNLTTTILVGQSSATATITIFDDTTDEGDEELKISVLNVPSAYTLTNNDVIVRVHDNDFIVQPWGTPLNPTYGIVSSTAPANYYSSLNGLSGSTLKQALQDIIADPNVVHGHTYGDVEFILKECDVNPLNSSQVWLMYVEQPKSKIDYQTSSSNIGVWNREHIFPQSRGGFQDGTFSSSDGINIWFPVSANDVLAGHGDAHHIRAEDGAENSLRGNRNYGLDYNGPSGTQGSWKGDVARALFYMDVRYNALNVVNGNVAESPSGFIGDLATLLQWHQQDPPDDFEMNRNNYIYTWQVNRNPFIDNPDLASYIFGSNVGQPYVLSNENFEVSKVVVYPNPTTDYVVIAGIEAEAKAEIYSITGQLIKEVSFTNEIILSLSDVTSGIYFVKISNDNSSITRKIIIK
ncbi:endonuclease [uncultured Flavobacterium sp.]|uniref:endonuclease n=1 Tax=uncultured Flavobacterium sp. TaxID=165435 RepID=UPI0030C885C5